MRVLFFLQKKSEERLALMTTILMRLAGVVIIFKAGEKTKSKFGMTAFVQHNRHSYSSDSYNYRCCHYNYNNLNDSVASRVFLLNAAAPGFLKARAIQSINIYTKKQNRETHVKHQM